MTRRVTAQQAFARAAELSDKPQRVILINHCPDCLGTGKIGSSICHTCGNEPDNPAGLMRRGSNWYKTQS